MASQREKVIARAKAEVGYKEAANGWTKFGEWYFAYMNCKNQGFKAADWCAMFCAWCMYHAGLTSAQTVFTASAGPTGETLWRAKNMWKSASYKPKPGDLIHFTWGHVGIVEKVSGNTVYTIEGNYSNTVAKRSYSLSYSGIRGYAAPNYKKESGDNYMEVKNGDINNFALVVKSELKTLKQLGYITTSVDDKSGYGSGSVKAVKEFQKKAKLTVDGIVGEKTIRKMREVITKQINTAKTALGA